MSRIERVNTEVHRALSNILSNELKDPRITGLITIVKTEVSADLSHAKVFITILEKNEKEKQTTFDILKNSEGYIRKSLANKLNMRLTPQIHFFLDNTFDEARKMEELIDSLHIPQEEE